MSRATSPYSRASGGSAALLPLDDATGSVLRDPAAHVVGSPRGQSYSPTTTPAGVAPVVTSATADFQRSLIQQQLLQSQKEVKKLKEELYETSGRLSQVTSKLNEQKVEYGALTHRYASAIEKLTNCEGDVRKLEDQLVQERTRSTRLREDGDQLKVQLRSANEDCARLQRELVEQEGNRGLDRREVQRLLEDRTQYIPTVEAQRMQAELRDAQQSLVDRLAHALEGLTACSEEEETNLFVARSAVLSAATDLEARVLRAEAALDHLCGNLRMYQEGLEVETNDFLLALMAENKELWQHLTKLQSEHDVALSELALQRRRGETVPAEQHQYVQRQLENMTERLGKAQQVMAAQTALAREHEREMQDLLASNAELEASLAQLRKRLAEEESSSQGKTAALESADTALKDATQQIRSLQEALVSERASADDTVRRLTETQNTMQAEFEQRLRTVQGERDTLEEHAEASRKDCDDALARIAQLEKELTTKTQSFEQYKARSEEAAARQQQLQESDMAQAQQAMERELSTLHQRLDEAQQEARNAVRERDDSRAETLTLRATVKTLEAELARLRSDADAGERQLSEVNERLRAVLAERDEVKAQFGATGMTAKELEKQMERLARERAELSQQLKDEQLRGQQRYAQVQQDWRASEKARTNLQEELKLLRMRVAEMETARQSQERTLQDREHLMKENLRLHEQYTAVQQENAALSEELKAVKARHQSSAQLVQQLQDLQHRLRELPQLRQAADDARREALKAREETEVLRKERDDMAAKLDYFLEESKAAAQMDEAFDKVVRDAGEAVKRLGGQVHTAKTRGAGTGAAPTGRSQPSGNSGGREDDWGGYAGSASPPSGLGAVQQQQQQQRSPARVRDAAVLTREAAVLDTSSRTTPQRPWKA